MLNSSLFRQVLLFTTLAAQVPQAAAVDFYHLRGGHSFTALFGIPAPSSDRLSAPISTTSAVSDALALQSAFSEPAPRPASWWPSLALSVSHVNMFSGGITAQGEDLLLDGERTELTFSFRGRVSQCSSWLAELPIVAHGGGFMDNMLEEWHSALSLPNGNRADLPQDRLNIRYEMSSGKLIEFNHASVGPGDVSVAFVRSLRCANRKGSLLRLGLKLPTGNEKQLEGSGAVDAYADWTSATMRLAEPLNFAASIGLLLAGKSPLFDNQRPIIGFGVAALEYTAFSQANLLVQVDWHSEMFDSDLTELGKASVRLTMGTRWHLNSGVIDFAVQEDLTTDTSPDFGFMLGFKRLQP